MNILRNLAFCRKRNCKRKAYTATPFFHKPMSWQSNTMLLNIKNDGSHCKKEKKMQDDFIKSCLVIIFTILKGACFAARIEASFYQIPNKRSKQGLNKVKILLLLHSFYGRFASESSQIKREIISMLEEVQNFLLQRHHQLETF